MAKGSSYLISLILSCIVFSGNGQLLEGKAQFLEDSVKIGMPTALSVSVNYSITSDIILPDSSYDFSPFLLDELIWFKSKPIGNEQVKDSVIYYLKSFELDTIQSISLKLFQVLPNDSLAIIINSDSFVMRQSVQYLPDILLYRHNHL